VEKEVAMPTLPLPARPNLEQLKKQAKDLQRGVRSGAQDAVALVTEHHPDAEAALATADRFPLDAAQLVVARHYGFTSWPHLSREVPLLAQPRVFRITPAERYHARANWASELSIERSTRAATSAHPVPTLWRPLLTAHHNGVEVIAFDTPAGLLFCELTPTTITLSQPTRLNPQPDQATLLFHTRLGTMAGLIAPEVRSLSLERPADRYAHGQAVVSDGIFLLPNAFTITDTGLVFRTDDQRTGNIVPADALPQQSVGVADRPQPSANRTSPAARRLAAAIARADAPPAVDPDNWEPGAYAELTSTESFQLGRYGNLLAYTKIGTTRNQDLTVADLDPEQDSVWMFPMIRTTIGIVRAHYDFTQHPGGGYSSNTIALLGLINDKRVASITLTRPGKPETTAVIANETFILAGPALIDLQDKHQATTNITVRDKTGTILEKIPYQRQETRNKPTH
jgi:hypothetical protein